MRISRITDNGTTNDLATNDLIASFCVEYAGDTMENFGEAMFLLLDSLPDDRLWSKATVFRGDNVCFISVEGIKRKVFEEVQNG